MPLPRLLPLPARLAARRRPPARRPDLLAVAAAALVNERYTDRHFSAAGLAAELHVPALTLRVRFRRFYGLPLDELLAQRRLELATVLMASTPHRLGALEEIAQASGYRGVPALDRDFLRWRGTPALAAWFRRGPSRGSSAVPGSGSPGPGSAGPGSPGPGSPGSEAPRSRSHGPGSTARPVVPLVRAGG